MDFLYKAFTQADLDRLFDRLRGPQVRVQRNYLVDEAHQIYFVDLGQPSLSRDEDPRAYFNLLWGEHTIMIEARPRFIDDSGIDVLRFEIARIGIPKALHCDLEYLWQTIEEAVAAYWSSSFRAPITTRVTMPVMIDWY